MLVFKLQDPQDLPKVRGRIETVVKEMTATNPDVPGTVMVVTDKDGTVLAKFRALIGGGVRRIDRAE